MAKPTQQPVFSLITVCFNAKHALIKTIESIRRQDSTAYEHLIIDGGSTDSTCEFLQESQSPLIRWISEPDNGLYDAMNKGLDLAKGQFVWFINAGDLLEKPTILSELLDKVTPELDILYGDVLMVDPYGNVMGTRSEVSTQKTPQSLTWKDLRFGMVVSHQAFIPRRSICKPYIIKNLCADIDWVIDCLKQSRKTVNTHMVLALFETGGLSRQRHKQSLVDRYYVLQNHFGFWPNLAHHVWILLRAVIQNVRFSKDKRY